MKVIKLKTYLVFIILFLTNKININPTFGQSIIPANDGTGTIINQEGNQFNIEGGTLSGDGTNLFHSLEKFGLNAEQIANFLANPQIRNILTRIVGGDPSIINGLIQITGGDANLFLMNPAGIVFGPNIQLNLPADFTVTTATGIGFNNNYWFNALGNNNYQFLTGEPSQFAFDLAQSGSIINTGNLSVGEGNNLTLIGETIINTGTLKAPGGNITIAAIPGTNRIRISQPGSLISLEIIDPRQTNPQLLGIKPQDLPTLLTEGTQTLDLNITGNNDGTLRLTEQNINVPTPSGTLITSGTLATSSPSQVGGNVTLIGDRIGVIDAQINASGPTGGGIIRIGGDYRGQETIPTAQRTLINSGSKVRSDALNEGNGGQITVWSEEITGFYGNISSQGGLTFGNGGLVEISGQQKLIFRGTVNTSAVNGLFGTLLLDPLNIIIKDGEGDSGTDGVDTFTGNNGEIGQILTDNDRSDTIIFESELEGLSGDTNIILEASNNIIIEDLSDNALTFQPGLGTIVFRANTDQLVVGSFTMSPDDTIVAPGRDLTIERVGNNLMTSGCRQMNSCQIIVGNIDTSFADGGGSVTLRSQGNTNDNVPIITVETINTSSTNGSGGTINIETLATNGDIRGTVTINGIDFDPNQINQFTQDMLNTTGINGNAAIIINGVEIEVDSPVTPPQPPVTPPQPPVTPP
ncbi:MAG: filamentous hemagglutinin N-terminal domain-containing protein, partial [Crocosphaera sp.]|nr:filamentous hemagglutinin N-terminal domain-containing protein [Crocosphaera sp.]